MLVYQRVPFDPFLPYHQHVHFAWLRAQWPKAPAFTTATVKSSSVKWRTSGTQSAPKSDLKGTSTRKQWFFMVFHGFSWFFMFFHGCSWFFMVFPSKYRGFLSIFPTKPCKTSPMNAESRTKTISKRCPPSSPSSWQWSAHSWGQISDYHQIGKEEATYSSRFVWICSDHIMSTLD